jgi:superfamily I DNA/RNA helicase/mRNA-degrading endonuclease RelE of RelBE toxin-antitoxin system
MEYRIADTFTDSLARLTGEEQKAVKTTAFDLQIDPSNPGLSFHKLEKARDRNFWSVRVNRDIRLIVHKSQSSLLLCYVGHHDKAYDWAERRRLETHPKTGAAQIVEIRETIEEIRVPKYVEAMATPKPRKQLFLGVSDGELLGYGVPIDWLDAVRKADEDSLFSITDHLPAEAAEALLELAVGAKPGQAKESHTAMQAIAHELPMLSDPPSYMSEQELEFLLSTEPASLEVDTKRRAILDKSKRRASFDHPDAQRRFKTIENAEELRRALDFPWDKWTIFLHPEQRALVERDQSGPVRVSGSAGTGKTIVALHRAVYLARTNPEGRVLLATYSQPLANALATRLRRLISNEPRLGDRIDVAAIPVVGERLYRSLVGPLKLASREVVLRVMREALGKSGEAKFSLAFLMSEWDQVVDASQLNSWERYRDTGRLGRKTRLNEDRRKALWAIFDEVQKELDKAGLITEAGMFARLTAAVSKAKNPQYEFAVVDEAQDISASQLKFFAAQGGNRPNALFFAGDLGQRIFQQPFSWKALGVDVRGRARTLRVNYRTSHQIRAQADRLLEGEISDVDGNAETRRDAISVFNGVPPVVQTYANSEAESGAVGEWLAARAAESVAPHEIGVFVRSAEKLDRAKAAVEAAKLPFKVLDERVDAVGGLVAIGTMHLAKGLEFRAVAVMACDDEVIPLQARIDAVGEDSDLKEVYDTERQLLYVACTRARDFLLVTGVQPASEFLDDLLAESVQ